MKKLVSFLLVLVMITLTLVSCGKCDEHIDEDADGKCDVCGENVPTDPEQNEPTNPEPPFDENVVPQKPTSGITAALTEAEWAAAFDFENVTMYLYEGESADDLSLEGKTVIVGGSIYLVMDGEINNITKMGAEELAKADYDFSADYDDFEFVDGEYRLASKTVEVEMSGAAVSVEYTDIVIVFDSDKRISYFSHCDNAKETPTYNVASLRDYGTTTVPEHQPLNQEDLKTYSFGNIAFDYPKTFNKSTAGSYANENNEGMSNFNVRHLTFSSSEMSLLNTLTNDSYGSNFVPAFNQQGISVIKWDVQKKNNGNYDLVIAYQTYIFPGMYDISFKNAIIWIKEGGQKVTQITTTALNGVDEHFVDVIINSIRPSDGSTII